MGFSLTSLAENYFARQDYAQAERYFTEALAIRIEHVGEKHHRTALAYHNLARIYHAQGRLEEAEAYYQKALELREKALGSEHPTVAKALEDYVRLLYEVGQEKRACVFEARIRNIKALQARPGG